MLALHAVIELLSALLLGEEAGLNASDSGTEENGGECDQREASGDNNGARVDLAAIDAEHKAKSDCTTDETGVPDKENLLPLNARVVSTQAE